MNRNSIIRVVFALLVLAAGGVARGQDFKPNAWLEDFAQLKREISAQYANLEWAIENRGLDLKQLAEQTESRLLQTRNEAEAKKIIVSFLDAFGDGHLSVQWAQNKVNKRKHRRYTRRVFFLLPSRDYCRKNVEPFPFLSEPLCVSRGRIFGTIDVAGRSGTWSSAEYFAAMLRDNDAATIIGEPTGGAGCGYTNGGIQTFLKNSNARVKIPDCIRLRADDTNEVAGITPDVLIPWRLNDSRYQRVKRVFDALSAHISRKTNK